MGSILRTAEATLVHTAVGQFVCKFGGEMLLQLLQLADFSFVLDSLLVMVWTLLSTLVSLSWCAILGERCTTFVWLSSLGFSSRMIL
jgi:hypothetical protein